MTEPEINLNQNTAIILPPGSTERVVITSQVQFQKLPKRAGI